MIIYLSLMPANLYSSSFSVHDVENRPMTCTASYSQYSVPYITNNCSPSLKSCVGTVNESLSYFFTEYCYCFLFFFFFFVVLLCLSLLS